MSKFPEFMTAAALGVALLAGPALADGDPAKGEKLFKRCAACHAVGEGAKNKLGPHLNGVVGREAGAVEGYRYSPAMQKADVTWTVENLEAYLTKPRDFIKGNRMAFPGLPKAADRADVIAYLAAFEAEGQVAGQDAAAEPEPARQAAPADKAPWPLARDTALPEHGTFHLGRRATAEEIAAWDIDVRPDGTGLPEGRGTVADGEPIFTERCASCHGDFGEGRGRWPVLAGGFDTLTAERPVKTVGSYWPYLSTVYDYIHRAMPFGDAQSLTDDEVYALTAYILYLNDVVTDEDFELSRENFASVSLPNEPNFIADERAAEAHYAAKAEPCMTNCKPEPAKVVMRARVLDVTPDGDETNDGAGAVD
ncbi:c-type cytochrome [Minwuia thermotolerans]|uniref:MFS transporter n=1 Tax=Minwuia thermotolerans TaxID=2056226 RepID=A0A2M9G396_9PROT|nr:c-type cytochrome [Minwuia thermotolerans]PJK30192.1 MFS transporter [Minwuia thermotolerans]